MTKIATTQETLFETIKHINEHGQEYWTARELQPILEYKKWENFEKIIEKAKQSCESSGNVISDHFPEAGKMVTLGSGSEREVKDYNLSRYACYLIAMNGNPKKKSVALAQTYFAVKTRQQELTEEEYEKLSEDQRRLLIRSQVTESNKSLYRAAKDAGVETKKDYAVFTNKGYQGLYGGLTAQDIHAKKGLNEGEKILDYMGGAELAANLFRITQTDEKLRRDKVSDKNTAGKTHFQVGYKVRQTIEELGGTMPEELPTPKKSIKQIEKENRKLIQSN